MQRVDITDYLREFLIHLAKHDGRRVEIRSEDDARRVLGFINVPENTRYKSIGNGDAPIWNQQKIVCIASNLQNGYLFYFICNGCGGRVKYLYQYYLLEPPLCRRCLRIPYPSMQYAERKRRRISNMREANVKGLPLPHSSREIDITIEKPKGQIIF